MSSAFNLFQCSSISVSRRQITSCLLLATLAASAPLTGTARQLTGPVATSPGTSAILETIAEAVAPAAGAMQLAPAGEGVSNATPVPESEWSCGPADAVCSSACNLANVGSTLAYQIDVGAKEIRDMAVVLTLTAGQAIMAVSGPQAASVNSLLAGPWPSKQALGTQAVTVPAAALVAGTYNVTVTAAQQGTVATLSVTRDTLHRTANVAQEAAVQQVLDDCCGDGGCSQLRAWQAAANATSVCLAPGNLCSGGNVRFLNLGSQDLSCQLDSTQLSALPYLEDLNLSDNDISIDMAALDTELKGSLNLTAVNVASTHTTGTIGCPLVTPSLQQLNVSNTEVTGSIPFCLAWAPALVSLAAANASLTGTVPELKDTLLQFLDLSNNALEGTVPSLAAATKLAHINMQINGLSGPLPPLPSSVQLINLSQNSLSGSIPADYGDLAQLQVLSLAGNLLSGSLPPDVASVAGLVTLDLSDNRLTDGLEDFAASLPTDGGGPIKLGLSGNSLTGSVPDALGSLRVFHSTAGALDLSGNNLTGTFPMWMLSNLTTGNNDSTYQVGLQGNNFTCPSQPLVINGTIPTAVTEGLTCHAAVAGKSASAATAAILPIAKFFTQVKTAPKVSDAAAGKANTPKPTADPDKPGNSGTSKAVGPPRQPPAVGAPAGKGHNKKLSAGLVTAIVLMVLLFLVAVALGGWLLWRRKRGTKLEKSLAYNTDDHLWKGPPVPSHISVEKLGTTGYQTPPPKAAGGLNKQWREQLSTTAPYGSAVKLDMVADEESPRGDVIKAAYPNSVSGWAARGAAAAAAAHADAEQRKKDANTATTSPSMLSQLRSALGMSTAPAAEDYVTPLPRRHSAIMSAGTVSAFSAATPVTPTWGPLGTSFTSAGDRESQPSAALSRGSAASPRRNARGQPVTWHKMAMHTAAEERARQEALVAAEGGEYRTPYSGPSGQARRRSPT